MRTDQASRSGTATNRSNLRVPSSPERAGNSGAPSVQSTSLTLNLFPATLSATTATVWVGLWPGTDGADAIRTKYPGLQTWRDRDDSSRLYIWHPVQPLMVPPTGFTEVTVALEESPQLFQRLVTDAVATRLRDAGFQEKGADGWVNYKKPGLFAKVPALAAVTAEDAIGIYPKIVTDVFFTRNAADELVLGLVVDVLYTTRMDVTAAEWVAAGLEGDVRGAYVVLVKDSPEAARFPQLIGRVIGRIDGLRADRAVLTDLRDPALAEVPLASIAPEPTRINLGRYLHTRYEKAFDAGEKALTEQLRTLVRPQTRHRYARAFALERLQPQQGPLAAGLPLLPGLTVRLGEMVRIGPTTFPVRRLREPEYSFDRAGDKFARRVDDGLRRHGPYDSQQMRRRTFRLLVVAPIENKGDVTVALQKLLGGVSTPKNVFTGLRGMYRMANLQVTTVYAEGGSGAPMQRYAEAVNRALREAPAVPAGEPTFDLVLTIIHEAHRALPDSENPYFQTKALALIAPGLGVPTQAITIEKLRTADKDLQYILNTMAVACYAKMGGTSHVLNVPQAEPDDPTELIFGVGRSVRRVGRFGDAEETIGFATVFRANGEYLVNDCTPYCDDDIYERALEDTIRRTVERVATFEQLTDGSPLRLIFHVPRRPGQREERAILNAVGKLPRFQIDFAILHVNDDHHLQLFDLANTSPKTYGGYTKKEAALLPARGLDVTIGPRERLLTFIGVDQYRGHGSPAPLRLTLHKRSKFKDLDYLTQQLFLLSFMNAGTLNPGIAPVTVTYAEKLASLAGKLRGVHQLTVEFIQRRLGRKLWFV